jgi:Hint domain
MSNTELGAINTAATGGVTPIENSTYQLYTYSFTATQSQEQLSFLFRNDPGYTWLDNISLIRQGGLSNPELMTNGDLEAGGQLGNTTIPVGWNAIGTQGLSAAGAVSTNAANGDGSNAQPFGGTFFWVDGAVGGYDGISQQVSLSVGATYTLSFELAIDPLGTPDSSGPDQGIDTQVWVGATVESGSVACFAAGTRILTTNGEVAVEALQAGDRVVAVRRGGFAPVRWIGHRRVDLRRHPRPWDVNPVLIRAHAFGPDRPSRELRLSPDHAVYVDGALFRARDLLNGATIVQEDVATITYFHVELDAHDVLIANGLPAESFLDTGNRSAFANGGRATMAHPDFALSVWAAEACAPVIWEGPRLNATRRALLARAETMDWNLTADPAPLATAKGRTIRPQVTGNTYVFALPPGTDRISLHSRQCVPAHILPSNQDTRELGLGVTTLALDGMPIALDDARLTAGWHSPETEGLRWTDGMATLEVGGARYLTLTLAPLLQYWLTPDEAVVLAA